MSQWTLIWIGVATSLVGGAIGCSLFDKLVRRWLGAPKPEAPRRRMPAWLTGMIERIFFTILVTFDVSGYPIAMIVWLVAKMAATWTGRGTPRDDSEEEVKRAHDYRISSSITLMNGLVSMIFALIGGLIMQYALSPADDDLPDDRASIELRLVERSSLGDVFRELDAARGVAGKGRGQEIGMGKYVVLAKDDRNPFRIESKWIEVEAESLTEAIDKGHAVLTGRYPGEPAQDLG